MWNLTSGGYRFLHIFTLHELWKSWSHTTSSPRNRRKSLRTNFEDCLLGFCSSSSSALWKPNSTPSSEIGSNSEFLRAKPPPPKFIGQLVMAHLKCSGWKNWKKISTPKSLVGIPWSDPYVISISINISMYVFYNNFNKSRTIFNVKQKVLKSSL